MAEPYLGEIRVFSFNTIPRGWMRCEGQLLRVNDNQALFSLLGGIYGGNGQTTFALPDLRGRVPVQATEFYQQGTPGGEASHRLSINELPQHNHNVRANSATGTETAPAQNVWAGSGENAMYADARPNTKMNTAAVSSNGDNQAHENMQPWQGLSFCISTQGLYPSRD